MKTYWSLTKSRKVWTCVACQAPIPSGTRCWYAYDYGGLNERRTCLACRPLPAYVAEWLASHPTQKPDRETFLHQAEGWEANALQARRRGNQDLARSSERRAAAMRHAAAMLTA